MTEEDIRKNAFAMPVHNPAYPRPPFRFINREYFIISYETDIDALRAVVPEPLTVDNALVHYEFIRMPDSSGFGDYTESGQVISVLRRRRPSRPTTPTRCISTTKVRSRAAARSGAFRRSSRRRSLCVDGKDTLLGTLDYGTQRIATGTMGYKYRALDIEAERHKLADTPNYLLKVHSARRRFGAHLRTRALLSARRRLCSAHGKVPQRSNCIRMRSHRSPICRFSKVVGARHVIANLTLDVGEVAYDYLAPAEATEARSQSVTLSQGTTYVVARIKSRSSRAQQAVSVNNARASSRPTARRS